MEKITERQIQGWFYERYSQKTAHPWLDKIVESFTSDQASEIYAGVGAVPSMTEMQGGRRPSNLREYTYTLENKEYEASIEIPSSTVRRDKTGQIKKKINELGARVESHKASLISTLIENGAATVCYDGQYFYDTDHSSGDSGAQSNKINVDISELPVQTSGTTTEPSPEEFAFATILGIKQILSFKDDKGELMNDGLTDFLVMAPLSLMPYGINAVYQRLQGYGASNIVEASRGAGLSVDFATNPRLTWTTAITIFANTPDAKPFVVQDEDGPNFISLAEGSEYEKQHRRHIYGVDVTRAAGYAAWDKAVKVTFV